MDIKIPGNSRVFVTGKTGSGKTYLNKEILKPINRLVVFDIKNNLRDEMDLVPATKSTWRQFFQGKPIRLQVTEPLPPKRDTISFWNEMLRRVFYGADCTLYIDELMGITRGSQTYPEWLRAIYTRGREPIYKRKRIVGGNIGVIASTQRPANIPLFCLTESEYFFVFQLLNFDDREKLSKNVAPALVNPVQDEHGFYYYYIRDADVQYAEKL